MARAKKSQAAEDTAAAGADDLQTSASAEQSLPEPEAAPQAQESEPPAPSTPGVPLIRMTKDGQLLRVHPTCVRAHEAAGWRLAG